MRRNTAIVISLLILLAVVAIRITLARPHANATITGRRFTAQVFSQRVDLANERLLLLEAEASRIESALGTVPPTLPVLRFYDAENFPARNQWVVGFVNSLDRLMLCLDARGSGATAAELALVPVHEYAHVLIGWRARPSGRTPPIWLQEGVAEYLSGTPTQSALRGGELIPLSKLSPSNPDLIGDPGLLYREALAVVTYVAKTYGEDRVPLLLDAYSGGREDGILTVCGITEAELLEQLRASLPK